MKNNHCHRVTTQLHLINFIIKNIIIIIYSSDIFVFDKWFPVTKASRVLRLRMEDRPPILKIAANKLNKQSRKAVNVWSSSLGLGRLANNASLLKRIFLLYINRQSLGP